MNRNRLSIDDLVALAPTRLVQHRTQRYFGNDISVTLAAFSAADQARLRAVYAFVQAIYAICRAHLAEPRAGLQALIALARQTNLKALITDTKALDYQGASSAAISMRDRVVHDVRGGAFQALLLQLQLFELEAPQPGDLRRMFFLARDHLKIMRNAIPDLDQESYARDRADTPHNVELLVEKWSDAMHYAGTQAATVHVDCRFVGSVSERCLEFAALDRVLYNLMNNAVRNTSSGDIDLTILPLGDGHASDLRFVIANQVEPQHSDALRARFGNDLSALFGGGFTTGGTGLGMRICADFVCNAYGEETIKKATDGGYLGARLFDRLFVVWFHWPIAAD